MSNRNQRHIFNAIGSQVVFIFTFSSIVVLYKLGVKDAKSSLFSSIVLFFMQGPWYYWICLLHVGGSSYIHGDNKPLYPQTWFLLQKCNFKFFRWPVHLLTFWFSFLNSYFNFVFFMVLPRFFLWTFIYFPSINIKYLPRSSRQFSKVYIAKEQI